MNELDYACLVCATIIFTWSELFEPLRNWPKPGKLRDFLSCPMCIGFWTGLFGSLLRNGIYVDPWIHFRTGTIISICAFSLFISLKAIQNFKSVEGAIVDEKKRAQNADTPVEGITLPGWSCPRCNAFNGSAKELLAQCRSCGEKRPARAGSPL